MSTNCKFPQHFLPSSTQKKHGKCLLLLLARKFRRSQHVNLKLWLFHVTGVKRWRGAECVHWASETVYVSSPAKLHNVFEFQHSSWFPPPAAKQPLWHRGIETLNKIRLNRFAGDTSRLRQMCLQSFNISAGVVFHLKDFTIWKV